MPLPMPLGGPPPADTTSLLLSDIRTGGMLPAASLLTFGDSDLLRLADREIQAGIVPLVMGVREEYFVSYQDFAITPGARTNTIRIPYRAIGNKVRDIAFVDGDGVPVRSPLPQLSLEQLEDGGSGFYVTGNTITLYNAGGDWGTGTARVSYFQRPNRLVATYSAGVVSSVVGSVVTLLSVPAGFASGLRYDFVRANPGYDCLAIDYTATLAGSTLTFATVPDELTAGDYVCRAGEAPVPQIPLELHPVLAQRVVVKALEAIGDSQGMKDAQAKLQELQTDALKLITPRVDGAPKRVVNLSSPFRRGTRRLGVW